MPPWRIPLLFCASTRSPRPATVARYPLRRWVRRSLLGLGGLVGLFFVAVLVLIHDLDQPWAKRRLQAIARSAAGVDVDYASVRVALLSGMAIDGLVVKTPPEFRMLAPNLLVVGRVQARWSRSSLFGHGPAVENVSISDVALTVVVDEHGRTSFDALPPSAPSVPIPLSHRAAVFLAASSPVVGTLNVDRVAVTIVREVARAEPGGGVETTDLRGLALALAVTPDPSGWRVQAGLGSPAMPLDLHVERSRGGTPAGEARARLGLAVDATSSTLSVNLDFRILEQTLVPTVTLDERLRAEANVQFDPAAGRTVVTLRQTELGEGAATAEASVEIPDTGDPVVRHAQGDLDLARALQWVPPGLVPVTAERAQVHYKIDSLVVGPVVRLSSDGTATVDLDLATVRVNRPSGPLEIDRGTVSLRGVPAAGGGVAANGSVHLAGMRLAIGDDRLDIRDLALDFTGQQTTGGEVTGQAALQWAQADRQGASALAARDGRVEVSVAGLQVTGADPLAARGDVVLTAAVASLEARLPSRTAIADGLSFRGHALLVGHPPYAIEIESKADRLRLLAGSGHALIDAPAHLQVSLHDVVPAIDRPWSGRGAVQAVADVGDVHLAIDATQEPAAVTFAVRAAASHLTAARPWLGPDLAAAAPWTQMAVQVRSNGRVQDLGSPSPALEQTTTIDLARPAFEKVAAESLTFEIRSKGTALRQTANADLQVKALGIDGGDPKDEHVAIAATLDRERPSLTLHLETEGRATAKVSVSLGFDRSRRAVAYAIDATLAGLAPLAPFAAKIHGLEGFDLSQLELGGSAEGTLLGVVTSVAPDGTIGFAPHPSLTAGVEGKADLRVNHLRWARGNDALAAAAGTWHAEMHVAGARRTVDSHLEVEALHLGFGKNEVDLAGISDETSAAVTGDLADPESEVTVRAAVRDVRQDAAVGYPVGDLAFTLSAQRDRDGLVHVSEMKLVNGAGKTALDLTGSLDLGARRRRLSLAAHVEQDLKALSIAPDRFVGRGKITVEAKVESPDLSLYRTHVDLKADDVHLRMPQAGIEVEAANGEIPIAMTFEIGLGGKTAFRFRREAERNPYSMLRFADQHALLRHASFISVASVKTPFVSIGPLAGNLAVEENVVSLSQFEMGVRGGTITGQCALDWDGPKSSLELHVRANGVQSSHGEPFDGNIAVVIAAGDRTVDGRAEVVRIGPRHLLDLLDMEDPLRVDPAMNRIRGALAFGYPKQMRLVFDHGFASAKLELGGLASLVSIGEIRGIPMGPIVDRFLGPLFDIKETR